MIYFDVWRDIANRMAVEASVGQHHSRHRQEHSDNEDEDDKIYLGDNEPVSISGNKQSNAGKQSGGRLSARQRRYLLCGFYFVVFC